MQFYSKVSNLEYQIKLDEFSCFLNTCIEFELYFSQNIKC